MDAIVTAALIGTAQRQNIDTITGTAVDKLAEKLPTGDAERSLLLSAGAWAIYRQAGRVADSLVAVPAPSTEETLPACSPEIAALIESLLIREQQQLLPEALEAMLVYAFLMKCCLRQWLCRKRNCEQVCTMLLASADAG